MSCCNTCIHYDPEADECTLENTQCDGSHYYAKEDAED